jgi:hypothetical protein
MPRRIPRTLELDPDVAASVRERLLAHCRRTPGGCWLWDGCVNPDHGRIKVGGRPEYAHRAAYAAFVRPLVRGEYVLHRCDTPRCCNPEHLYVGDLSQNGYDRWARTGKRREPEWPEDPPF